jgi:hypothetical protein
MEKINIRFELSEYPDDLDYCDIFEFKLYINENYAGYLRVKYITPVILKSKISHPLLHLNKLYGQVITQEDIDQRSYKNLFEKTREYLIKRLAIIYPQKIYNINNIFS